MVTLVIVSGVIIVVGLLVAIKASMDSSGARMVAGVAMVVVGLIGAFAFAPSVHEDESSKMEITTVSLGDREVVQGAMDVELAQLKLTTNASSDVVVDSITITESIGGSVRSSRAVYNLELWTGPVSNPEHKLRTKISGSVYATDWGFGRFIYVISIDRGLIVPAGATIDLLLVGDILSDALPGSTHIVSPGNEIRDGATTHSDDKGRSTPRVRWQMPDDWPKGNVITIVEPATAKL